jgi:hypothetical protein
MVGDIRVSESRATSLHLQLGLHINAWTKVSWNDDTIERPEVVQKVDNEPFSNKILSRSEFL